MTTMKKDWNVRPAALSRRTMLRGLGGLIALPWLEAMGGKAFAATDGAAIAGKGARAVPPRLACFYIPGGIERKSWYPAATGKDFALSPSLMPLERHRAATTVLSGLSHIQGRITGHVHP